MARNDTGRKRTPFAGENQLSRASFTAISQPLLFDSELKSSLPHVVSSVLYTKMSSQRKMNTSSNPLSGYQLTWLVVGCGAIGGINLAKLGPAMSQLIADYSLSLTVVGLMASIFTLISVFIGVFIGSSMQNIGPKRLVVCAMVCAGLGGFIAIVANTVPALMLARALEGIALILTMIAGPTLIVMYTNPAHRGKYLGVWGGFMPIGNSTGILAAPLLLPEYGWQGLWLFSGMLAVMMGYAAWRWIPDDPKALTVRVDQGLLKDALGTHALVAIGLVFASHSLIFQIILQFIPLYTETSLGLGLFLGTLAAAIFCILNFFGNVMTGRLIHRGYSPHLLMSGTYIAMPFIVALLFAPDVSLVWKALALFISAWMTSLTPPSAFYLVSKMTPSPRHTAAFNGYMLQVQSLGILIGPLATAWAVERFGGWEYTSYVIGISCVLTLGLIYWAIRPLTLKIMEA